MFKNEYVISADYGPVKDRTSLCMVHSEKGLVILDALDIFQGSKQNRVQIDLVNDWINDLSKRFNLRKFILDNYQLESVAQKWEKSINVERFSFQGQGHFKIAENLKTLIVNKKIKFYPNAGQIVLPNGEREDLVDELASLIMVPQGPNSYRVDHLPGKHDDRYCSLALAAYGCVQLKIRYDIHEVLDSMIHSIPSKDEVSQVQSKIKKEKREILMPHAEVIYTQIHYIKTYGSYQVRPIINNSTVVLGDYPRQELAAYSVNHVYKLYDLPEPNEIPEKKLPSLEQRKEIEKDTEKFLKQKGFFPNKIKNILVSKKEVIKEI